MFDSHIHTKKYSPDASIDIEEILDYYKKFPKIKGIVTTEHFELFPSYKEFAISNILNYLNDYDKYPNVLKGIEVGYCKDTIEEINQTMKDERIDFILLSSHKIHSYPIFEYISNIKYYSQYEIIDIYLNELYDGMKQIDFDSLAHIDFLTRYLPSDKKYLEYEKNEKILKLIFEFLIKNDKSLEINCKNLKKGPYFNAFNILLKNYKKLGGQYITIGSDIHHLYMLGNGLELAIDLIKKNKLILCHYEKRKRIIDDIK